MHLTEAQQSRRDTFRRATWPKRTPESRLYAGCDPIHAPKFVLSRKDRFFAIGSCFARNIEEYLRRAQVDVVSLSLTFPLSEMRPHSRSNDLLMKYTPASICAELSNAFRGNSRTLSPQDYIVEGEPGKFYDLGLPTMYPGVSYERALERRISVTNLFSNIASCDVVVLTLGLIEHWFDTELGVYIATEPNKAMLNRFPNRFEFRLLSYDDNRAFVEQSITMIAEANPSIRVVMTTSPVPLMQTFTEQDVIVANAYSKSTLRSISQEIASKFEFVDYFPSYEMVTLSPPDVAWENDLRHVKDSMVGKVMAKFFETYFDDAVGIDQVSAAYTNAKQKLDQGDLDAFDDFSALEDKLGDDKAFLTSYCVAAVAAKRGQDADRISSALAEKFPGAWSDILRARALILTENYSAALDHLSKAKSIPTTLYHAGGWEMEVGRLVNDPLIETAGARSVAEAICSEVSSADKKPWIKKRMLAVLKREKCLDELERLEPYI